MKYLSILAFLFGFSLFSSAQTSSAKKASFVITIDIAQATKDGIYMNGYVVNIPYEKLKELNGKTVRISGKVVIVKGVTYFPGQEISQGREEETKHILKPRIKIIK